VVNVEEALKEVAKLQIRIGNLAKADEAMLAKLEICVSKWEKLCLELEEPSKAKREVVFRSRSDAYEALREALESLSKVEHERSHIPESLGSLLLDVENSFQRYLRNEEAS
jgi:hypothetical protein